MEEVDTETDCHKMVSQKSIPIHFQLKISVIKGLSGSAPRPGVFFGVTSDLTKFFFRIIENNQSPWNSKLLHVMFNFFPTEVPFVEGMSTNIMLNKNTLGVKKCEANQKQHCKQVRPKTLISVEAKKLLINFFLTT